MSQTANDLHLASHLANWRAGEVTGEVISKLANTPCQQTVPEPIQRTVTFCRNLMAIHLVWRRGAGQRLLTQMVFGSTV